MPRRDDIHKILILGSGPIVIGQAAEFDYSGVQACKVLREEGYEVVLVNSNPATIMTDPEFADATYVEPLLPGPVAQVIERERPDALLPTLGGQTALNLAKALHEDGTLERFGVELIGANYDAIACAEDRDLFREAMDARRAADAAQRDRDDASTRRATRWPTSACRHRPPGVHARRARRRHRAHDGGVPARSSRAGSTASPIGQVLLDQSVLGWGEFELEVMRDHDDNVVIVCSIENVDPMGVHTGDSVTVAPQQTLTDRLYQQLRDQAIAVIRAVGVETGGSNVQFAVNPETEEILVIEMNPRVSRSSRAGLEGDRASRSRRSPRGSRSATRWRRSTTTSRASRRRASSRRSTTSSSSGRASRSRSSPASDADAHDAHEVGRRGDGDRAHVPAGVREGAALARARQAAAPRRRSTTRRCSTRARAPGAGPLRRRCSRRSARGASVEEVHERTRIDPWFLRELRALALDPDGAVRAASARSRSVDTCAAEFAGAHALLLLRLGARGAAARGRARRPRRRS